MAEEVEMEVQAVEAVYGPDCAVFCIFPPHLSISLKPRTADDLYIQFVEAKLIIKATAEYPNEPPKLELKDAKGLGDQRLAKFLEVLDAEAKEMSGEPMLVAICEVATDMLTQMNVPDGDCCFCMNPFMMEDGAQPFMKLMSCFHCFHRDCFGNWWRWLQHQERERSSGVVCVARSDHRNIVEFEDFPVNCPVCRIAVHAEDVAHVREFLTATRILDSVQIEEAATVPDFVLTIEELERRARFSAEFEAQQARGAIIEPKKLEVILPGMIVPPRTPPLEVQLPLPSVSEENQPSPFTIDSPVASVSSPCETITVGTSHSGFGIHKEHFHQDNGRQSRGRKGRRGGNSRGSHVGWRKHHVGHKGKEDLGHQNSPRQHSHPSAHQPPGTSEGTHLS